MSDKMRWRYGDMNPVVAAVDRDTEIQIGDLLWQDTDAKPAYAFPADQYPDLDGAFAAFIALFLGVAMQHHRRGDETTATVRVSTTGVFEFDCDDVSFELGTLIGPILLGTFRNQQVARVFTAAHAIGRAARQGHCAKSALVDIRSTIMTGGVYTRN